MAGAPAAPGPLFLVGAPRSGTSLLYKALCLHPDTAWISNWLRRAPGVGALGLLNRVAPRFPETRRRVWFGGGDGNAYVYAAPRSLADRLFPMPVEGEPVYRRCGVGEQADLGAVDPGQADRLRHAFAALRRHTGRSLVVSKRIANNQRIPLLAAAFPDARFVHLVRDGRAVAASLSRVDWWETGPVWWYGDTPRRWREQGGDPWELCARHWVRELASIEEGLGTIPADQRIELRYEELVGEPVATLSRVARFAALPARPAWTTELELLRYPDRTSSWRERLDPEARSVVEAVQAPYLERYRYAERAS
jgi:Sulfotransferase family